MEFGYAHADFCPRTDFGLDGEAAFVAEDAAESFIDVV
jgi:hypothetical protein